MAPGLEIQLIAAVTAAACALLGTFLVLRGMAMMSDAISHTVLLGIVLSFLIVRDLDSPFLVLGAAIIGLVTVSLTEALNRTKLVKQDAAIGLVFPALFSIAVILISRFTRGVHLDNDAVLLGELAFAPFDRTQFLGLDLPHSLVTMSLTLLFNALLIRLFFKELKLATFDAGLAATLGFSPVLIHYGLMGMVSVTAVGAFEAVGSILLVGLMVAPPATAYLLTDKLERMLGLSVVIGAGSAVGGYWLARSLDANIAGSITTVIGAVFLLTFFLAPQRGIFAIWRRRKRQRYQFAQTMLTVHLFSHEAAPDFDYEREMVHLQEHLRWTKEFAREVVRRAQDASWILRENRHLALTESGREHAKTSIEA